MTKKTNKEKGFTLIELLVVIAIIGLLSSVVLASLNAARIKGYNSYTIQTIEQYKNAFSMYYNDKGYYPAQSYDIFSSAGTGICLGPGANSGADQYNCLSNTTGSIYSITDLPILKTYYPGWPIPTQSAVDSGSVNFKMGGYYLCSQANNNSSGQPIGIGCAPGQAVLEWVKYSSQPCGLGGAVQSPSNSNLCVLPLN